MASRSSRRSRQSIDDVATKPPLLDCGRRTWRPLEKGHDTGHEVCVKYCGETPKRQANQPIAAAISASADGALTPSAPPSTMEVALRARGSSDRPSAVGR